MIHRPLFRDTLRYSRRSFLRKVGLGGSAALAIGTVRPAEAAGVDFGFDFCSSTSFVTHPQTSAAITTSVIYPTTTINGIGFSAQTGWTASGVTAADRSVYTGTAASLSSIHYVDPTVTKTYRIDLDTFNYGPGTGGATTYQVIVAFGDATTGQVGMYLEIRDNATPFIAISNVTQSGDQFWDASGVLRTSHDDWVNNQASINYTFSSTICNIVLGNLLGGYSTLAHFRLIEGAGSGGAKRTRMLMGVGS